MKTDTNVSVESNQIFTRQRSIKISQCLSFENIPVLDKQDEVTSQIRSKCIENLLKNLFFFKHFFPKFER